MRQVIGDELDIIEWESGPLEGQEYLSAGLRIELAGYSERDLLLPWVAAWCRRRVDAAAPRRNGTVADG